MLRIRYLVMMNRIVAVGLVGVLSALFFACSGSKVSNSKSVDLAEDNASVAVPRFNADSAYRFIEKQVSFGPRVPNTKEHKECGLYLEDKLKAYGATVVTQEVDLVAYDGTLLKAKNIIASYQPELKKRVALFAHWDTRPWSDNDPDEKNHRTPVLGANDGASGVGVLLEIARLLQQTPTTIGIDIIFFDAEDYGVPQFDTTSRGDTEKSWGLGSQYWAKNLHTPNYNARFGILLDMVGDKDALFYYERYSQKFAKNINKKVWNKAHELGFQRYFIKEEGGYITDDHLFVNEIARIPTIDIIHNNIYDSGFAKSWHTVNDTMENIERNTLHAVGQTVLAVIYNEK